MSSKEEALKDFNDNLHQSNINSNFYHVKGIKPETIETIRKALEAKEPEVITLTEVSKVLSACFNTSEDFWYHYDMMEKMMIEYPNGIVIKGDE
jgi:hypothetical protein